MKQPTFTVLMPPTTSKMTDAITEHIIEHISDKKQNSFKPVKVIKAKSVSPDPLPRKLN